MIGFRYVVASTFGDQTSGVGRAWVHAAASSPTSTVSMPRISESGDLGCRIRYLLSAKTTSNLFGRETIARRSSCFPVTTFARRPGEEDQPVQLHPRYPVDAARRQPANRAQPRARAPTDF